MNISAVFVRRPIATSLLMLAVALFGVLAYAALPVSDLPSIDFPTLSVGAGLPGGDPETLASSIASPLERQFTAIAGLDSMTSSSALGTTSVTLQFDLDRSIDGAAVDVQTAIAEALPLLPPGMPNAPTFRKVNPADQPIFVVALAPVFAWLWVWLNRKGKEPGDLYVKYIVHVPTEDDPEVAKAVDVLASKMTGDPRDGMHF